MVLSTKSLCRILASAATDCWKVSLPFFLPNHHHHHRKLCNQTNNHDSDQGDQKPNSESDPNPNFDYVDQNPNSNQGDHKPTYGHPSNSYTAAEGEETLDYVFYRWA